MAVGRVANSDTFKATTPSDREIVLTRLFDAPRRLVFEAMTKLAFPIACGGLPPIRLGPRRPDTFSPASARRDTSSRSCARE